MKFKMSGDQLTMGYFVNHDNGLLNKYQNNLQKKIIDVFLLMN